MEENGHNDTYNKIYWSNILINYIILQIFLPGIVLLILIYLENKGSLPESELIIGIGVISIIGLIIGIFRTIRIIFIKLMYGSE